MKPIHDQDGATIYQGDNCAVMCELPAESVDLVVTSPPYDDLRTYGGHDWDFYGVAWLLKRLLKPGGVIVWIVADQTKDGSETGTSMRQALHFQELGLNLHDTMIFQRPNAYPGNVRYSQDFEYMFVLSKGAPNAKNLIRDEPAKHAGLPAAKVSKMTRNGTRVDEVSDRVRPDFKERANVWQLTVGRGHMGDLIAHQHPAIFPEALARDHIHSWSNEGDTVLDPFAGSFTTAKMAKLMGRKSINIEINEDYVQIGLNRLRQNVLAFPE